MPNQCTICTCQDPVSMCEDVRCTSPYCHFFKVKYHSGFNPVSDQISAKSLLPDSLFGGCSETVLIELQTFVLHNVEVKMPVGNI